MARQQQTTQLALMQIATGLLVIAGLYWAQTVLVPIAIAIMLGFLLTPIADALERIHVPRVGTLILIASTAILLVGAIAFLVGSQAYQLADSLPKYRQNIEQRLRFLTNTEPGAISKAAEVITKARKDVAKETKEENKQQPVAPADNGPMPVEIHTPPPSGFQLLKVYAAPIVGPVGQAALVFIFVLFILYQREDLRDRMIRLLGQERLDITTRALDDAGSRISRYLLTQAILNLSYGVPIALGLWLLGLPGALLWGVLAALLRFIPILGPWLAASMPILLSLAVFDGWYWPLAVAGLFLVLELISNQVLEPWLYGSSTGLSPIGVVLAVVFWSALWGLVGLVVAIPLTVCLVVAGRHLPQFRFFPILLGRDPALTFAERFYQRLLAGDQYEVEVLAHEYLEEHGLLLLYDQVMVPAMHLAERSRHAGQLRTEEVDSVLAGLTAIVDDAGARQERLAASRDSHEASTTVHTRTVLCLPARDAADELAATMFSQVLRLQGMSAETGSAHALVAEKLTHIDEDAPPLVCVSALPPGATSHARYLCRRLRSDNANLPVIVGLWDVSGNFERMRSRLTDAGATQVVTTFEACADSVRRRLSGLAQSPIA